MSAPADKADPVMHLFDTAALLRVLAGHIRGMICNGELSADDGGNLHRAATVAAERVEDAATMVDNLSAAQPQGSGA
jgi:hypothetical protein